MTAGGAGDRSFAIRRARADDFSGVLSVLDGANLETDADTIGNAIGREAVLVAESDAAGSATGTLLGALVLDGNEVVQIAVRRRRRGQGIGTALVHEAMGAVADDHSHLIAEFDAAVRPFYEALGFEIEPATEADRLVGRIRSDERFDDFATGGE